VVGAAAIWMADAAWSRAGGGGHAGTSYDSGNGHSPFSGIGIGAAPGGLITLVIIVAVIWYFARRSGSGAPLVTAYQAAVAPSPTGRPSLPPAIETIGSQDPAFEMECFLQRAEMTFFLVKRGMQRNDPAAVRPYLNDAVFTQVASYLEQMRTSHRHALFESLNVRAVHVEDASSGPQGQSIRVHFDLVYRLKTLDEANHVLADEGSDGRHGEQWTFARAAGAKTPVNGDVTAAVCPACGAQLKLNLDGTCTHCRASVTNGTVDWIVADVSPAPFVGYAAGSPLAVAATSVASGIAALTAADPKFSQETFKSRVAQAFLSLQDAWCKQNLDAGRAFLSPGAYFSWSAQLEALAAEGRRNVMENVTVQGIEVVRVVHGRVFDDLTVRVSAAAADFDVDQDNRIVFGDRRVEQFSEYWTFQRSIGVASIDKPGTLESTCPNCGAPVALTQIGECRYCKAAITSGKFDWVVSRIEQEEIPTDNPAGEESPAADLALQVGGAVIGGLLGNLLSGRSSNDSNDSNDSEW
jgi:predicted lipid-binding transport protein (Tim44 family)